MLVAVWLPDAFRATRDLDLLGEGDTSPAGAVIHLQVDVGYGDAVVPPPTTIDFPQILEFTQPHIRAYSRYTVVAEKLQAAVELGLANSRLKDFFDPYMLSSQLDFDGPGLVAAIRATFDRRDVAIPSEPPMALTARFSEDPGKLAQWRGFLRRARVRVQVPALPEVIEKVACFAIQPLEAARLGRDFRRTWRQGGPWT
jgi:hypothetical protein